MLVTFKHFNGWMIFPTIATLNSSKHSHDLTTF
jgi:hypothetical protein